MKRIIKGIALAMVMTLVIGIVPVSAATTTDTVAKSAATASTEKAVPSSVRQTAYNAFEIDFVGGSAELEVNDFKTESVYWEIGPAIVPFSAVKSVKSVGGAVTVTMYAGFTPGRDYKVNIAGVILGFTAANNDCKAVDRIEITTATAVAGVESDVVARMYDAQGIDITDTAKASADISWSLRVVSGTESSVDTDGFKVNFDEPGQEVSVQAVLSYYDTELEDDVTKDSPVVTIAALPAEEIVVIDAKYSVEASDDVDKDKLGKKDWFAMEDEAYLCGKLTYSDKNKTQKSFDEIGEDGNTAYAYSCNENICMVTDVLTNKGFELTGIATGTTAIIVAHRDENDQEVVDAVCPVTVREKRVATKFSDCGVLSTKLNANSDSDDWTWFYAKVLDQYNEVFTDKVNLVLTQNEATSDPSKGYPVVHTFYGPFSSGIPAGYKYWRLYSVNVDSSSLVGEKNVKFDISVEGTSLKKTVSLKMKDVDPDQTPTDFVIKRGMSIGANDTLVSEIQAENVTVLNNETDTYFFGMKDGYFLKFCYVNYVSSMPKKTLSYGAYDGISNYLYDYKGQRVGVSGDVTTGASVLFFTAVYNGSKNLVSDDAHAIDSSIVSYDDGYNSVGHFSDNILGYRDMLFFRLSAVKSDPAVKLPAGTYTFQLSAMVIGENDSVYVNNKAICDTCKITVVDKPVKVVPKLVKRTSSYVNDCATGSHTGATDAINLVNDCWEMKFSNINNGGFTDGVRVVDVKYVKNHASNGKSSVFVYEAHIQVKGYVNGDEKRYTTKVTLNKLITSED